MNHKQGPQGPSIIVALDAPSSDAAIAIVSTLDPALCRVKVGLQLYTAEGPDIVEVLQRLGFDVFLDLKFKDIPNTVAGAVRSACDLGVWMLNIHADGGSKMMQAAVEAAQGSSHRTILLGVTVLTSMDIHDLEEVGVCERNGGMTFLQVLRLAKLAQESGLDGIVCSGQEAGNVRELSDDFLIVTPGIRLPDGNKDDQARIVTPEMAVENGADYLVVGRPITGATNPMAVLRDFNERVSVARG